MAEFRQGLVFAGVRPPNLPHTNYGCSYQRNFGLMLADPGDLLASEGDAYVDAQRSDLMIGLYRAGQPTGAELPESEPAFGE
jgi:type IV pilus biogenesis protein CpaD/CtpE